MNPSKVCAWCGGTFVKRPHFSWRQFAKTLTCSPRCGVAYRWGADTIEARFWGKVDRTAGADACWIWTAFCDHYGYGKFNVEAKRPAMAHRVAYEWLVGPIPDGLELDHLCRNPPCVNPAHLEPVTHSQNVRRGKRGVRATSCRSGHPHTPDSVWLTKRGDRICKICMHEKRLTA